MDTSPTVVLDVGSDTIKGGLAANFPSESEPRVVTPPAVRNAGVSTATLDACGSTVPGDGPVVVAAEGGRIVDWEAFEALMYYLLYQQFGWELGDEGACMYAEPVLVSKSERERVTQLFFETFNVSSLFCCDEASLALYSVGKLTGTVVDLGHTKIDISTVVEGQVQASSVRRHPYGMRNVAAALAEELAAAGQAVEGHERLRAAMQGCVEVCESEEEYGSYMQEGGNGEEFTLPDGTTLCVGGAGRRQGEALLQGWLPGADHAPLHESVYQAVQCIPETLQRKAVLEGVMLCGGGSAVLGLPSRLMREVRLLCPPSLAPGLCSVPEYMPEHTNQAASWMGGAVLSKIVFQQQQGISKADYDEMGPYAVHKKCV